MPQAPDELRTLFEDDCDALKELKHHYTITGFVIRPKQQGHVMSIVERCAIDYLVFEWDYGFQA